MFRVEHKAKLHNRFDIIVRDVVTGEEQKYQAENILLNRLFSEVLCNNSGRRIGEYIAFGSGTGTLAANRTELFTEIGRKTITVSEKAYTPTQGYITKWVKILPEEHIDLSFSEVGLAWTTTGIETHALIEDSEGNPISIGPKTDTQEITIYSTFYAEITDNYSKFLQYAPPVSGVYSPLLQTLTGDFSTYSLSRIGEIAGSYGIVQVSNSKLRTNALVDYTNQSVVKTFLNAFTVNDAENKKKSTPVLRSQSVDANGKIWSYMYRNRLRSIEDAEVSGTVDLAGFRIVFPNTAYNGHSFSGKAIGTGNGSDMGFNLPWDDHVLNTDVIKVDGATKTRGTDYVIKKLKRGTKRSNEFSNIEVSEESLTNWFYNVFLNSTTQTIDSGLYPLSGIIDMGEVARWNFDGFGYQVTTSGTYRFTGIQVHSSVDKSTWDLVTSVTPANNTNLQDFNFNELTTPFRYLRFTFTGGNNASIRGQLMLYANNDQIVFTSPPANNAPITGDWQVPYVPKDTDHMFDSQFVLTFADGNA